jgi:hypothetical protein
VSSREVKDRVGDSLPEWAVRMGTLAEVTGGGAGGDEEFPWTREALAGLGVKSWLEEIPFSFSWKMT